MRILGLVLLLLLCGTARGADRWSLEAYGGDAFNFRNRLHISQDSGYARSLTADYRTRAFRSPPYTCCAARAGATTRPGKSRSCITSSISTTRRPA